MEPTESASRAIEAIKLQTGNFPTALVGFYATRIGEEFSPTASLIFFGALPPTDLKSYFYPNHRFVVGVVPRAEALAILIAMAACDDPFKCDASASRPFEIRANLETTMERSVTGWPEIHYRGTNGLDLSSRDSEALIAFGLQPYESANAAYRDLVLRAAGMHENNETIEQVRVVVSLLLARIVYCEIEGDEIVVQCEGDELAACEIHVLTRDRQFRSTVFPICKATECVSLPFDSNLIEAHVHIVHPQRGVLATRRATRRDVKARTASDSAMKDLNGTGEHDRLEFKPFIRIKDHKEQEILQTIVAFANSSGGKLYIGVDGLGVPQGLRNLHELVPAPQKSAPLDALVARVRWLAAERTAPVVDCDVDIVDAGEPVILVTVPSSSNVHCTLPESEILTRRGAHTRRANPIEVEEMLRRARKNDRFG